MMYKSIHTIVIVTLLCVAGIEQLSAQYQNIRVDNPSTTNANEVSIAVNPRQPNQLAAGANINYFFRSTNGGASWTQSTMSSTLGVWGDPCLMYDGSNNLYFAHLSNPVSGYWIDRIVVQKSTDNGTTWNDGVGIGLQYPKKQDKEWLGVDLGNTPYKNTLYCTWTEFDKYGSSSPQDSSRILFSKSTDFGVTWSAPLRINEKGGDAVDEDLTTEGAIPAIGPNGEIYVAWAGPLGILVDRSFDGGATFGTDVFVTNQPGGWDQTIPGIQRTNGFPTTLCDTSRSPYRGRVYITWSDQRNGSDNTDIFSAYSTDQGATWSLPVKVNTDNTSRHQFFPWSCIDQATGVLYVLFYDRRNTSGNATDVYLGKSTDGGVTFENIKISASSFTPNANVFFGDYCNIMAYNKRVYPIWNRMDNNAISVYTAAIYDTFAVVPVQLSLFTSSIYQGAVVLNWTTGTEVNNLGFAVERADYDQNKYAPLAWSELAFVKSEGNSQLPKHYTYTDSTVKGKVYRYRLKQVDMDGTSHYSDEVSADCSRPIRYALEQNYPNPFNPSTVISYFLPEQKEIDIRIFDVLGKELTTLYHGIQTAGLHEIIFDSSKLKEVPGSGILFCRLTVDGTSDIMKMMLLK